MDILRNGSFILKLLLVATTTSRGTAEMEMKITTDRDYFIESQPQEINCTSSMKSNDGIFSLTVNNKSVVTIKYTDQCQYLLSGEKEPQPCDVECGCSLNGRSIFYIYTNNGNDYQLTITCTTFVLNNRRNAGEIKLKKAYKPITVSLNSTSPVSVYEGRSIGPISCTADCFPECTFTWYGPYFSGNDSVLLMNNANRSDNGTYICRATNIIGNAILQLDVLVYYGPQDVILDPRNQTYVIERMNHLGPVLCSAECNPTCDFVWNGPGISTIDGNLTVNNVEINNTGEFACNASNFVGTVTEYIDVRVQYGPLSLVINLTEYLVRVNETGQLGPIRCEADCLPTCVLQWTGPHTHIYGGILEVNNIMKKQNGTYTCKALNQYGDAVVEIDVIVQYKPRDIKLSPDNVTYSLNESEKLEKITCEADCNPPCSYLWKGPDIVRNKTILQIEEINRINTGTFTCEARNSIGRITTEIIVRVLYAANVTFLSISSISKNSTYFSENTTLEFTCETDGSPLPDVKWLHTNISGYTREISKTGNHTIRRALCSDLGNYTCEASNDILPSSSRTKFVNITCPPRLKEECSSSLLSAVKRNQTKLIFACLQSNPKPDIIWTKSEKNESNSPTNLTSQIFINDTITYTSIVDTTLVIVKEANLSIKASNSFGVLKPVTFRVFIEDKPSEPMEVSVQCKTIDRIQWISNFDGGRDQVFEIKITENNTTELFAGENVTNIGFNETHEYILTNLKRNTNYEFHVVAKNAIGSAESKRVSCITAMMLTEIARDIAGVIGGTTAGVFCILAVVIVVIVYKRRQGKENRLIQKNTSREYYTDEEGLKDNPMYVSSDLAVMTSKVEMSRRVDQQGSDVVGNTEYAHVDKNTRQDRRKPKTKKKQDEKKSIEIGCVYENAEDMVNPKNGQVNKKSHSPDALCLSPKKNKDGLLYADLSFSPSSSSFVIRGLENRSIYADIDLTKKADPIPSDSDDDDNSAESSTRKNIPE